MLQFHWSTFVFQVINFFILLAVLTRFFYRPLQRVMARQEEEINSRLQEAEERARKADAEREQLASASQRLQIEKETLLATAKTEAAHEKERLLERARQQADRYMEEAQQRVRELERTAQQRMEKDLRHTAVTLATHLMQASAGPILHQALLDKLLQEGLPADGEQGELLRRAYTHTHDGVTVEVAYASTPGLEEQFGQLLAATLGVQNGSIIVNCRTEPSLLAGARILLGTVVVDLSLSHTLAELSHEQVSDKQRE